MKNKWVIFLLLAIGAAFLAVSCKSTASSAPATAAPETTPTPEPAPEPEPEPPAPELPSQAALDALDDAMARAEKARKRAGDFEAASRFPGDWADAEADYAAAGNRRGTPAEVNETQAAYKALADR
jgi:glucose/arabinose dehydrogenase